MSAKKVSSDRKRSRPVHKKTIIDDFKKNKLAQGLVVIIVFSMVVGAGLYYLANRPNPVATIETSKGTIKVELYKNKVPNTVDNFISYANDGFYEGLVFHRVIDDFMIQGGGFYPNGTRKETKDPIDLEINNGLKHVDGAIAMARTNEENSATSQFYICDGKQSDLDGAYAVFGQVIQGMDVVREISSLYPEKTETKYGMQNWPSENITILSVSIE